MHFNDDPCNIYLNKAVETFKKSIPFKIYCTINEKISGTTEHTHDYMQIWYVMSGCCEHKIEDRTRQLTKGDLFVIPPFVTHKIKLIAGKEVKIIGCEFLASFVNEHISGSAMDSSLFDFSYLEPFLVSTEHLQPRLHVTGKSQAKIEELMLDMLHEFEQEKQYYEINIKADLLKLLAIIAREYENSEDTHHLELFQKYRDAVSAAIKYIDENYSNKIYIEDVCKIAMMSQTYFSYIFKQITGKTFVEYINGLRIRKAAEILKTGNVSITDISLSVGFNDAAYFNKVFKKETGLSPSQYKKLSI